MSPSCIASEQREKTSYILVCKQRLTQVYNITPPFTSQDQRIMHCNNFKDKGIKNYALFVFLYQTSLYIAVYVLHGFTQD